MRKPLRQAFGHAREQLRHGLDLPSRAEVHELNDRLDRLDRKLDELEAARSADVHKLEEKIESTSSRPKARAKSESSSRGKSGSSSGGKKRSSGPQKRGGRSGKGKAKR